MKYYQSVFFALFLIISLFIRFFYIDYGSLPNAHVDASRDYLVADHIISYGEIPLRGHHNFFLHNIGLRNSPIYYYILAIFLIPYNDMITLAIANVFFQVAALALIFFITKLFFSFRVAILAVVLFGFIPFVLNQSIYIWQPHLMQTIALLALYLLSLAYLKKNYKLLIGAIVALTLGLSIHFSVASWIPQFILVSFLLLRLENKKIVHYIGVIFTFVLAIFIFHLPVFLYFLNRGFQIKPDSDSESTIYAQSIGDYFVSLMRYFYMLIHASSLNIFIVLIVLIGLIGYIFMEKRKRRLTIIGMAFFLSPIFAASLFEAPVLKYAMRYITLSFSLFAIIFSVLVNFYIDKLTRLAQIILRARAIARVEKFSTGSNISRSSILTISLWVMAAFVLLKIFSQDFSFLTKIKNYNDRKETVEKVVSLMESQILNIKQRERLSNLDFFQIISFTNRTTFSNKTNHQKLEDAWLLVPLEKKLKFKLVNVSSGPPVQTNNDDYIFLACYDRYKLGLPVNCVSDFLTSYPNYFLIQSIYTKPSMSIFLLKKEV